MVRDYELMLVLDPNLDDEAIEAQKGRVSTAVTQRGGVVAHVDPWGRRRLAYPINRNKDGFYVLFRLQLKPESTSEIERSLKLTESVIRHLLVRLETTQPAAPAAVAVASV